MSDWHDFEQTTNQIYGVNMDVLEKDFDREQKEYFLFSSRWTELPSEAVLAEPKMIKHYDMVTCTVDEARGIAKGETDATFDFEINGDQVAGPISAFSGWFTADFRSRTDEAGIDAPKLLHPSFLSTGPENGYTHWGQQTFYLPGSVPTLKGETTRMAGSIEMMRTKENSRLYNCRISYSTSRQKNDEEDAPILMKSAVTTQVYQIP